MVGGGSTYARYSMLSSEAGMDYLYKTKAYVTTKKTVGLRVYFEAKYQGIFVSPSFVSIKRF